MRKIKFRGKTENDIWKYGSLLKDNPQKTYYIIDNEEGSGREVLEKTLGQYTGLKDKNGKEIYEGDIVRKFNGIIGKVIYEHSEFIIDVTNNKKLDYGRLDLIENFVEVIGNIYDNSDLLEKGAEE